MIGRDETHQKPRKLSQNVQRALCSDAKNVATRDAFLSSTQWLKDATPVEKTARYPRRSTDDGLCAQHSAKLPEDGLK